MASCPQPNDDSHQVWFRHRRAAGCWMVHATANVKKNRATGTRNRRIGIVSDVDKPMIGKIARTHFFVTVIIRRIFRIDYDVTIIIRRPWIIAPDVGLGFNPVLGTGAQRNMQFGIEVDF